MNIKSSLEELEIYKDNLLTLDKNYIKKKYHQLALKWHPDKNNHPYAKTKFQKINESYDFLIFELNTNSNTFTNSNTNSCTNSFNTNNSYINILTDFFSNISKSNNNKNNNNVDDYDIFLLIKDIIIKSDTISKLKEKFKLLNHHNIIKLYQFLYKYKDILHINDDILELVNLVINEMQNTNVKVDTKDANTNTEIKETNPKVDTNTKVDTKDANTEIKETTTNTEIKETNTEVNVFILKPTLIDLMDNNIYKLYVNDKLYLVPLWHNELYFEEEIIVLCQPILSPNITIDEDNNICYVKTIYFKDLPELIKNNNIIINIGNKLYSIPLNELYIKNEQFYIFKEQGISLILEKDIYNINYKSDIIVKINLL
jgi:hypothetical protein